MNGIWIAGLAFAALLLALTPVGSAEPFSSACEPWIDRDRVLVFGVLPLGAPLSAAARLSELPGCFVSEDRREVDCEYADADGIAYLFDADGLLRIEARRGEVSTAARLPLGLTLDADQVTARAQLARVPHAPLRETLQRQADSGALAWATPSCVRAPDSEAGSWYLEFDRGGGLRRIGWRLDAG